MVDIKGDIGVYRPLIWGSLETYAGRRIPRLIEALFGLLILP